jgi:hypothetical protein
MAMRLNMQESSLKKKRGISFFVDNRKEDFDLLNNEQSMPRQIHVENMDGSFSKPRNSLKAHQRTDGVTPDRHQHEPETAIDSSFLFKNNKNLEASGKSSLQSNFIVGRNQHQ